MSNYPGSKCGRLTKRSRTGVSGIRFDWAARVAGPMLRVIATCTDQQGRAKHTSFSVEANGLEGALDKALQVRLAYGAPAPDRSKLLQLLHTEYTTRNPTKGATHERPPASDE